MSTLISVAQLEKEIASGLRPQMIDVRTVSEFAAKHIPCAVNIPMDQFESRRGDLALEDGVVLICKGGTRAKIVAGWLSEYAKVRVLEGGTDAWIGRGLQVVSSARTRWSLERQVRLGAGLMVLSGTLLVAAGVHAGLWLAMFVGAGLTFAGATDVCAMGIILSKMPWNRTKLVSKSGNETQASASCCR